MDLSINYLFRGWGFFCLNPFKNRHFPYDLKITLIILNVPERHLDCYLVALEVKKEKVGGKKNFIIKYILLNFLEVVSSLFRF